MNCPNCGMELGHETEYCINCGAKQAKAGRFSAKKREQGMFNKDVVTGSSIYTPNGSTTGAVRNNADDMQAAPSISGAPLDEQQGAGDDTNGKEDERAANAQGVGGGVSEAIGPILVVFAIIAYIFYQMFTAHPDSTPSMNSKENSIYGNAYSKTAAAVVAGKDAVNVNATVGKQVTQVSFSLNNAPDNITLPNGEQAYEYNGTIVCDGEDEDARIHVALLQEKSVNFVICNVQFDNDDLFEIIAFSLPLVIDGESALFDVSITVDEYQWTKP